MNSNFSPESWLHLKQSILENPTYILRFLHHDYDPLWDFSIQQRIYKVYQKARKQLVAPVQDFPSYRIAIVGSDSLFQLAWLIELHLVHLGLFPEVYKGGYGLFRQEILDPNSGLYQFQPDCLIILTSHRDLTFAPTLGESSEVVDGRVKDEISQWLQLWMTFKQQSGATIIQNNFDIPDQRLFGSLDTRLPNSFVSYVSQINHELAQAAPDYVLLHDLEYLSAYYGKRHFFDPRFYHYSKQPCSFEVLPAYANSLGALLRARIGKIKKCLVLDLDNTLWGGVIGDDGINGIQIGQGTPEGEAHLALQRYAKSLTERGILLAVCSKNTHETAIEPFEQSPDMLLRLDDIACFVANWQPKSDNIRLIADTLNIGLDSLVFVDDNPMERELVHEFVPEVSVPDLPDDPSLYVRTLVEYQYFETTSFSQEDTQRTAMYVANRQRADLEGQTTNLDDFLAQLEMIAEIEPINSYNLERAGQLIARSNQFNLTTRRHDKAILQDFMEDPAVLTRTIRLKDRFGDNGIISIWIGKRIDETILEIDTWVMSCRVLKRGVEQHLLNEIVQLARADQIRCIRGVYIPTAKNGLVANLYGELGFSQVATTDDGSTIWELTVEDYTPLKTAISSQPADAS